MGGIQKISDKISGTNVHGENECPSDILRRRGSYPASFNPEGSDIGKHDLVNALLKA